MDTHPAALSVSVIVVTYRTGDILKSCIESLLSQETLLEIIVVDNGNPPALSDWLDQLENATTPVTLIRPGRNMGFAAGCNLGARQAKGDVLAFVNPDALLPDGGLKRVLDVLKSDHDIWICGGIIQGPDNREQQGSRRETLTLWRAFVELFRLDRIVPHSTLFRRFHQFESAPLEGIAEVPAVSGAFMVCKKMGFEAVKGFDEGFFLHFDDSDLCYRTRELGGKVVIIGDLKITHYLSTSDVSRLFIEWHKSKSVSHYFFKHFLSVYPSTLIILVSLVGWARFFLIAPFLLIRDMPGIFRRLGEK